MALKVCNTCTAKFSDGENCPECLQAGRGEIRDYHFQHDETEAVAPASTTEETVPEDEIPEDEEYDPEAEAAYDASHTDEDPNEDLSGHSKNRLIEIARERGLDTSGTKAEILARLQEEGQG